MNKKLLIGIIAVAGVLLLGVFIILVVTLRKPQPSQTNTNDQTITQNDNQNNNATTQTTTTTNGRTNTTDEVNTETASNVVFSDERTLISRTAMNFTERYGSFSSDNNFDNLDALAGEMTAEMKQQAEKLRKQSVGEAGGFYSISTQAIAVGIVDYAEGATGATVTIDSRRTEQKGVDKPTIFSQTARLQLNKVNGEWKVDSFKWL